MNNSCRENTEGHENRPSDVTAESKAARCEAAFGQFYQESFARLNEKNDAANRKLPDSEPSRLLVPFQREFARVNSGGKMLRGMLVNLGYKIAGGVDISQSDDLALAFELFQTAVLIHDDVIDKAETRRGKTTIHRRYEEALKARGTYMVSAQETARSLGESAGICVGDLGLYYANQHLAASYAGNEKLSDLMIYFNRIIIDTIRGELLDVILPYEIQDPSLSEEERKQLLRDSVMEIYHLKTALYSVIGPLHLGTLLGRMKSEERQILDEICDNLGIAFQIKDDLLGVFSAAEEIGKDAGSDVSEFKQTILYMFVRTMAKEHEEALLRYYGKEDLTERELNEVRDIFRISGAYDYAISMMEECFAKAQKLLDQAIFLESEDRDILEGFIHYLRKRKK